MRKVSWATMVFIVGGLMVAAIISYVSIKEAKRNNQIEEEINALQQEAEKIKNDNNNLQEKISYFETPEFQEKVAKEKLNLQKPEEQVVIVKPSPSIEDGRQVAPEEQNSQPEEEIPNYRKWWNQFFR